MGINESMKKSSFLYLDCEFAEGCSSNSINNSDMNMHVHAQILACR